MRVFGRVVICLTLFVPHACLSAVDYNLEEILQFNVGTELGQCRTVPVDLGDEDGIFLAYCQDAGVDPYVEMFFFPKHRMKISVYTCSGTRLWTRELGPGLIPGTWFVPFFPFDLDADGVDEIWFVNNIDDDHPLSIRGRRLERLDVLTGRTIRQYPWLAPPSEQSNSHRFRNFILGGYVKGRPVLVTAQGTYGAMKLQGWDTGMNKRWEYEVASTSASARGSHMCPVVDIDNDGSDEILWGERCVSLDTGRELFCADRDSYRGHSDVIAPILDRKTNRWYFHTCRETSGFQPRIVTFNDRGGRVWGDLDKGHMDMGWVARLGPQGEHISMAIRIGSKSAGPKGFFRKNVEEFTYESHNGKKIKLDFGVFGTLPVDLNGDGLHELVRGGAEGNGEVLDRTGRVIGNVGGSVAMVSKFMDHPGEQILCYSPDGTVRIWADKNAKDSATAKWRYSHPFYKANQRLTATGSNRVNLGGL
jgi:hypothetical protein